MRWRPAVIRATILSDSWYGSYSASLRNARASSSARHFGSSSRTAPSPMVRIWGSTWRSFSPCLTRPRTSGRRILMKHWLHSSISTAICSPRASVSPISIGTCVTAFWHVRGSTGRRFRRPFSVRSSRERCNRRSDGNSAATIRANATFSKSFGRFFWTIYRWNSSGSRAIRTNSSNSTRRLPASVSSTRPADAATSSWLPIANCGCWKSTC